MGTVFFIDIILDIGRVYGEGDWRGNQLTQPRFTWYPGSPVNPGSPGTQVHLLTQVHLEEWPLSWRVCVWVSQCTCKCFLVNKECAVTKQLCTSYSCRMNEWVCVRLLLLRGCCVSIICLLIQFSFKDVMFFKFTEMFTYRVRWIRRIWTRNRSGSKSMKMSLPVRICLPSWRKALRQKLVVSAC